LDNPIKMKELKEQILKQKFGVRAIPSLILVENTGKLLSTQGRMLVEENPTSYPWSLKPLNEISKSSLEILNTQPCILLYTLESKFEEQKKIYNEIAEDYFKKFEESKDEIHPLTFFYADPNSKDTVASKICQTFFLPQSRPILVIINIELQAKYIYHGEFTPEKVREWIEGFLVDKLTPVLITD